MTDTIEKEEEAIESQTSADTENAQVDEEPQVDQTSEPALLGMLAKDIAVVFAALSLWAAADTWYEVSGLWLAQIVSIGDAIVVGLLLAALFHEWGHYAGAQFAKAKSPRVNSSGLSLFRFNFKYAENDHKQFHWMTGGGHVMHWSLLILLLIALPLDSLGRIALVGAVFGFVAFASIIEYNIVRDTWAGADPETRVNAITKADFKQATIVGTLAGLFAIAGLA